MVYRSGRRLQVFQNVGVLKNFAKFAGQHLCRGSFFNIVAGLALTNLFRLGETHLVVVRGFIYQVSPKCVNEESSTERRNYNSQVNRSPQL